MSPSPSQLAALRVEAAFGRLEALLQGRPEAAERLVATLHGDLEAPDLEDPMTEVQVSIRIPADLMGRAEALVEHVERDSRLAAFGRVTRAAVMRLAMVRGIEALEAEHGLTKKED